MSSSRSEQHCEFVNNWRSLWHHLLISYVGILLVAFISLSCGDDATVNTKEPEAVWAPVEISDDPFVAIWGCCGDRLFLASAYGEVWEFNGAGWIGIQLPSSYSLFDIGGSPDGAEIFVVGRTDSLVFDMVFDPGMIARRDYRSWVRERTDMDHTILGVWVAEDGTAIAAGSRNTILRRSDSGWEVEYQGINRSSGTSWVSVWGAGPEDVFAVGLNGRILHYDGTEWLTMVSGTDVHLNEVWGNSGTDVFCVGMSGTILHFDGSIWTPMESSTEVDLSSIWGSSSTDVYAVGGEGTILHFNGNQWTSMQSGTDVYLYDIWGRSAEDVYAVGWHGTVLHRTTP